MGCVKHQSLHRIGPEPKGRSSTEVLVRQGGVEHGRVVGVERDVKSGVEQPFQGMARPIGRHAQADIARRADLKGHLPLAQFGHQGRVFHAAHAVPDAVGVQIVQR
jgi:hypothetical protein